MDKEKKITSILYSPCHSFILDLEDTNWHDIFDEHELEEIDSAGSPLIRPPNDDLTKLLHDIKSMVRIIFCCVWYTFIPIIKRVSGVRIFIQPKYE